MTLKVKCCHVMTDTCCLCCTCTMRTGAIILGWIMLFFSITAVVTNTIGLTIHDEKSDMTEDQIKVQRTAVVIVITSSAGEILLLGILIFGIHAKRPSFMLPYLVIQLVWLVLMAVGIVVFTIIAMFETVVHGIIFLLLGLLIFFVSCYIWDVFYSYYRELEG